MFSNESDLCLRWPKQWSFSCSISPSSEYSGLEYVLNSKEILSGIRAEMKDQMLEGPEMTQAFS